MKPMYDSDLQSRDGYNNKFEKVFQQVKELSIEEKAELVQSLLGKDSGLVVVPATLQLADYIIAQMSLLSTEGIEYVLSAIAYRLVSDFETSKN